MGSFSSTCCVSGLPIEAGDDVRFFMLTQSPYEDDSLKCYIHDLWFPRSFPLRAKYNDYGSVEEVEGGAAQQAWLDLLKIDLAPVGWGENSAHDTSTSKDMTFEQLLEALWEARVKVRREVSIWALEPEVEELLNKNPKRRKGRPVLPLDKKAIPKGVPTRKRLEKLLIGEGFKIYKGSTGDKALIVQRQGYGRFRLRGSIGAAASMLPAAERVLKKAGYATMITKGVGSYSFDAELLVRPPPTVKDYHYQPRDKDKTPILVRQAMIREDVWRALCTLTYRGYKDRTYKTTDVAIDDYRKAAHNAWEGVASKRDSVLGTFASGEGLERVFLSDPVPFMLGTAAAFKMMGKKFARGEVTDAEVESFLNAAAEFNFIGSLLIFVRYQWRPTYANGPQFGEWGRHRQFFEQLSKVTEAKYQEKLAEMKQFEEEYGKVGVSEADV